MRAYTVAATAVTLEMPGKWVDNTLSHFQVPGVSQSRQGVSRKLTPQAILILAISLRLTRDLGIPFQLALDLAKRLAELDDAEARLTIGGEISLGINVVSVARDTDARLAHAVEVTPIPRRGRPPRKHRK